jgi:hypothetical protein
MITALLLTATLLNPTGKPAKAHAPKAPQVQVDTIQEIDYLKKVDDVIGQYNEYDQRLERKHLREKCTLSGSEAGATFYASVLNDYDWC